jgi:hypothetical protein
MFSLSLNPPQGESVSVDDFEDALDRIESKLGLSGQPRVIVFHEKEARRHAHCVWSRIDIDGMKAINLPHFKRKLCDVSKDLYLDHGWQMPRGFARAKEREPFNFSREQWQQARRTGQNPKALKQTFRECWAMSDSAGSFASALKERGLYLAQGDRRGFVAVDHRGEVYSIAKWTELRTKEVRAKLGDPEHVPTVAEAKELIASRMSQAMTRHIEDLGVSYKVKSASFDFKKAQLVQRHQAERKQLAQAHERRWINETRLRSERVGRGFSAVWQIITGKYQRIRRQNEQETLEASHRDKCEKQALIDRQLTERRAIQQEIQGYRKTHTRELTALKQDQQFYSRQIAPRAPARRPEISRSRGRGRGPSLEL